MNIEIKDRAAGTHRERQVARKALRAARSLTLQMHNAAVAYDEALTPRQKVDCLGVIKANLKTLKDAAPAFPWMELGNLAEVERTIALREGEHLARGWYGPNYTTAAVKSEPQ
jgi:hypothetical protein